MHTDAANVGWRPGDRVEVRVAFEGDTARVTLRSKAGTVEKTLLDVPACGLCFGVGLLWGLSPPDGVTLVASSVDAGVRIHMRCSK